MKKAIVIAMSKARSGVDYSRKGGAACPLCGKRVRVYSSPAWSGGIKVRYHHCENPSCLLSQIRTTIKSIEAASERATG
ncbi:hypothetical protein JCM16814_08470 [Desulfobaculum senezii]